MMMMMMMNMTTMVMMVTMMMMLTPLWTQNLMILLSVMDGRSDGRTDGRTDTPAYWDAMDASKNHSLNPFCCNNKLQCG